MIAKFFNLQGKRQLVSYTYQNPQALEVKIQHKGNYFSTECLKNIAQILSTGNNSGSCIGELFDIVDQYKEIAIRKNISISQQIERITDHIKEKKKGILNAHMPSEFKAFQQDICHWLTWHQEYFSNIALMTKEETFKPSFFNSPLASLKENIKQDIEEAIQQGELIAPYILCKKAQDIMNVHDISLSIEPCY